MKSCGLSLLLSYIPSSIVPLSIYSSFLLALLFDRTLIQLSGRSFINNFPKLSVWFFLWPYFCSFIRIFAYSPFLPPISVYLDSFIGCLAHFLYNRWVSVFSKKNWFCHLVDYCNCVSKFKFPQRVAGQIDSLLNNSTATRPQLKFIHFLLPSYGGIYVLKMSRQLNVPYSKRCLDCMVFIKNIGN